MIRAVVDTNVMLSALLGGVLSPLIDHWRAGRFTLVVTAEIVREYLDVLRRPKFALPPAVVDEIAAYILRVAEFVTPLERLSVVEADPKDDKFVEAALAGTVELIVSGDQHLLRLRSYRQTRIITAREFLELVEHQ